MTKIKICGIKEKSHAIGASRAGADFIGVVLAPSPRQVSAAQAQEIVGAVKEHGQGTETVGVFVNTPAPAVNRIAQSCGLDWVQLSGDETWAYCQQIELPLIKALHITEDSYPEEIEACLESGSIALAGRKHRYLLDSKVAGKYGGSGTVFDWSLARAVARKYPIILAGGLNPDNVATAVSEVSPWGVDVSSGVEVDGIKSLNRITEFITAVRRADKHG